MSKEEAFRRRKHLEEREKRLERQRRNEGDDYVDNGKNSWLFALQVQGLVYHVSRI